jgi:YesN/AraC family two-component response regulator
MSVTNPIARAASTLLVVEDDPETRRLSCSMIARRFPDLAIYDAENGKVGVELYRKHAPDLVITDINMPVMDGIQMAEEIKEIRASAKFIVLTGYSDKSYLERFTGLGVSDYILKPIEFRKLISAIEKNIVATV